MARKLGSSREKTAPLVRQTALKLFAQHGYAAVSMRQIARDVGVQVGALYSYTPNKQTLLFELMSGHMEELLSAWQPRGKTSLEQLEHFTRFHIAFHLQRPDEVFIAYMELRNLDPKHFTALEIKRRDYEKIPEEILSKGVQTGELSVPDVRLTTLALIAMLTGVTTWYRDDGPLSGDDIASHYWEMVRRIVICS